MNRFTTLGLAAATALTAGTASAQLTTILDRDFVPAEGQDLTEFLDGIEWVGNGNEGGGFFATNVAAVTIQAYGSRQVEIGIVSIPLTGVTLEAGTEYDVTATVMQFQQNWAVGQGVFFGFNDATNRPPTPSPLAGYTPDDGFNAVQLPLDTDNVFGPVTDVAWTFTPTSTMVDPLFVFGTSADDVAIFLDTRHQLFNLKITTGEDTGSFPGCNLADTTAPFGTLNIDDVLTFLNEFAAGCP